MDSVFIGNATEIFSYDGNGRSDFAGIACREGS